MTLYEVNKQAYAQLPKMTQADYQKACSEVYQAVKDKKYLMLLCKEKSDYTVFSISDMDEGYNELWNTILDIFDNRGCKTKAIEVREDGNVEYWVQDKQTKECFMYMLFDYEWGVIKL